MKDPTYVKAEIDAHAVWALAFRLSEIDNDAAPIGWSRYVVMADWILARYEPERVAGDKLWPIYRAM